MKKTKTTYIVMGGIYDPASDKIVGIKLLRRTTNRNQAINTIALYSEECKGVITMVEV